MVEFDKCPVCNSTKFDASDDGKSFKIICRGCGRMVEAIDTTGKASEKSRRLSAKIIWESPRKY